MIGCVAGCGDRLQHETVGDLDVLARLDGPVGHLQPRTGRSQERRPVSGELRAAGDVVGVGVGVGGPTDPPPAHRRLSPLPVGEPSRIDDQRGSVTEAHHVRAVAETLVDDVHDLHHRRPPPLEDCLE